MVLRGMVRRRQRRRGSRYLLLRSRRGRRAGDEERVFDGGWETCETGGERGKGARCC